MGIERGKNEKDDFGFNGFIDWMCTCSMSIPKRDEGNTIELGNVLGRAKLVNVLEQDKQC
jgi:hypothetical protein